MKSDTIRSVLDIRASSTPDAVFLIDPDGQAAITYKDMRDSARNVAAFVLNQDVQPGASVAFAMRNGPEAAAIILGLLYGGFRATAINLAAGSEAIAFALEHSGASLVFAEAETREILEQAGCRTTIAQFDEIKAQVADFPPLEANQDGLLMYTSGTTGQPKGVRLSHASLLAGGGNTELAHELSADDRALCVLPLYHINGLCVTLMGPLVSGGSVVMPRKFSPKRFWGWISRHSCSWFSVVPTQISYLLHLPPGDLPAMPKLRFGRSASAPLSPEVQEAFEQRFRVPIIETMGLTETAAQILSNPLPPGVRKIGSPGIAFGNKIKIVGEDGKELPRNQSGEILVQGTNVMSGYLNNSDANAAAFTADGWLRTGDLGRMDEDGYVFVTGRLKELIIKGGENIAPREIDEALYAVDGVIEAAAFALPCANYGQRIEAAVVVEVGIDEAMLMASCHKRLGKFKSPDCVHFLDELPKGPSGKIQRRALVEIFTQ